MNHAFGIYWGRCGVWIGFYWNNFSTCQWVSVRTHLTFSLFFEIIRLTRKKYWFLCKISSTIEYTFRQCIQLPFILYISFKLIKFFKILSGNDCSWLFDNCNLFKFGRPLKVLRINIYCTTSWIVCLFFRSFLTDHRYRRRCYRC